MPSRWAAEPAGATAWRAPAALAVMVASGFAGLGYQIVWTQQCALWLGHESAALLAVVTAFFGGLAVGALALGARIERSAQPARWYAACEGVIALWSLALLGWMGPASSGLLALTGAQPAPAWQWTVAFAGTFLLLLPATAAMGATLPAMARLQAPLRGQDRPVAALYACNTLGAVIGVLATAFWLVPEWGLARTAGLCAVLNGLCAGAALILPARAGADGGASASATSVTSATAAAPAAAAATTPAAAAAPAAADAAPAAAHALARLAATGLLGIGYEVLVVRVISQVAENTVYTFALLLAVYRGGTALGAAAYARGWAGPADAGLRHDRRADRLLGALVLACLLGAASLWWAQVVRDAVQHALGPGMASALAAEATLALLAFLAPTVVMGALFSHLSLRARAAGVALGRALGANTLGAAAAPLLLGVLALPALGAKGALLALVAGYLALLSRPAWARPGAWVAAGLVIATALGAPPLVFVDVPDGGHLISYQEGAMAAVSVVEDAAGVRRLRIDNRQQEGSSASWVADARQAYLPLLLHPAPQRVLFLGLGTGVTASAAADDAGLHVDVAELLPEVINAAAHFTPGIAGGAAGARLNARVPSGVQSGMQSGVQSGAQSGVQPAFQTSVQPGVQPGVRPGMQPGLHAFTADARRFVRAAGPAYDVIVSDNFHPARSGSGALYTVQHFRAVRARLAAGGVFCQWLPLHQLDIDTLRSIVQSFRAVYPGGWALLATHSLDTPVLGLVARVGADAGTDSTRFHLDALRQRLARSALAPRLADVGLTDTLALLGGFVAGPAALAQFAGSAPPNTDDRPVVAYRAPRITYAPDSAPRDRLLALLGQLKIDPAELVEPGPDGDASRRLAAYWAARDAFIAAGHGVRPSADAQAMLAQVQGPLLRVLRTSPDFRPAYDPLLRLAVALGRSDAAGARALLAALVQAQPARPEAAAALGQIAGPASAH